MMRRGGNRRGVIEFEVAIDIEGEDAPYQKERKEKIVEKWKYIMFFILSFIDLAQWFCFSLLRLLLENHSGEAQK